MTHYPDTVSLPDNIFCCDSCTEVDTRHSDKPYHDPNKNYHQAIYQSFLNFATRISAAARELELAQAHEAAEVQRQAAEIYAAAISIQEESENASMALMDMIRSYNPDHQKMTNQAPTPSLACIKTPTPSSALTSAFTLPSSPPFSPSITPPRSIIAQRCSDLHSISKSNVFGSDLMTPPSSASSSKPSSKMTSISSGLGQSFIEFLRNGVTALPSSGVPNLGSSITDSKIPEWRSRANDQAMQPLAQSFTPLGTSGYPKSPWAFEPTHSRAPHGTYGSFQPSTTVEASEPYQSLILTGSLEPSRFSSSSETFAEVSFDGFRTVQAPYWTQTEPEPFIPQHVLSPSNLIDNPLITNPPPTYVIHVTSRQDYGKTESHRYFVCPTDLTSDWPEVSLLQWFAAGVGYDVKAEKWDHKCLQHQRFFRMVLRPNLAMREWGLGKPLEELQAELAKLNAVAAMGRA
ncbi:predicted protein [Sclerotinia sclerotiorum 1980 UF-70]|uniref:Uncharacterized protein n=2 Tax=Sclerotinia sclerotiorum (strain ATCC 18683 / 1980 / Ss-1) TaxID=665079 RepID=A7EDI1_SCLS1|nr:predicted protein [Sclerotinia sclerotiorum 1980 UF-70]APA10938.1 hypothetical protein sscle_07g057080 [Sclerotinia sclerotiorum 1980 UF-70]EDO00897.1 predicted protein [Sclerotinia sclerotiorum 1980 UF-70]